MSEHAVTRALLLGSGSFGASGSPLLLRDVDFGARQSRLPDAAVQGLPSRVQEMWHSRFSSLREGWEQAAPFRQWEQAGPFRPGVAVFPLGDRVVVNEHGVFVPRSLFSLPEAVRFEEGTLSNGSKCVVVFAELPRRRGAGSAGNREQEMRWLAANRSAFAGRWVALQDGQLVGEGDSAREACEAARARGVPRPLVVEVGAEGDLPFAGW